MLALTGTGPKIDSAIEIPGDMDSVPRHTSVPLRLHFSIHVALLRISEQV